MSKQSLSKCVSDNESVPKARHYPLDSRCIEDPTRWGTGKGLSNGDEGDLTPAESDVTLHRYDDFY